jgi:hypothetical protein
MFFSHSKYSNLEHSEKKLKELLSEHEALNRSVDAFYKEHDITEETFARYNEMKEQFTPEDWEKLNAERAALEKKLKAELSQVRNPHEMEKRYRERHVSPHWLFVR